MKEKVILKSADVSKYPDYVIECPVISYDEFRKYIAATPQEDIVYAIDNNEYIQNYLDLRRLETVDNDTRVNVDGLEYILNTTRTVEYGRFLGDMFIMNYKDKEDDLHKFDKGFFVRMENFEKDYSNISFMKSKYRQYGITQVYKYCKDTEKMYFRIKDDFIVKTKFGDMIPMLKDGYVRAVDPLCYVGNEVFEKGYSITNDDKKIISRSTIVNGVKYIVDNPNLSYEKIKSGLIELGCDFTIEDIEKQFPYEMKVSEGFKYGDLSIGANVIANVMNSEFGLKYVREELLDYDDDESLFNFLRVVTGDAGYTKENYSSKSNIFKRILK